MITAAFCRKLATNESQHGWAARLRSKAGVLLVFITLIPFLNLGSPSSHPLSRQGPSSGNVLTADATLVILPVAVRDRRGKFVSGLDKSNFQVYEDKKPQPVSLFQHEDVPATVGLVVDHSGSMAARRLQVIEAAQAFVQVSNPQDHEFVVNFSNSVALGLPTNVAFTNDVTVLLSALSTPTAGGQTALYDALLVAMHHIQKAPDKKALLLISDGGDNASHHKFPDVLRAAQESNITIYAIGLFDENSADQNPQALKKLADETGGRVYLPNSFAQLLDSAREIAADIRHQYTLGYSPPDPNRSGYRKVRVTVSAPRQGKLYVRTRAGYFLPSRTAPASAATNGSE